MNVAFDPWIPVVSLKGERKLLSLETLLAEGEGFSDLAVRPHERVALMRLLLCVAHAALDGPKDYDEWLEVPKRLPDAARKYLEKWKDSFELFHPERPWLQVAGLSKGPSSGDDEWTPVSKLFFFMASGNNTTLLDHAGTEGEGRDIPLEATILAMLSFQCFSTGGLISQVFWNGTQTKKVGKDGPCCPASMLHSFLRGGNMLRSLQLNMPTYEMLKMHYGGRPEGRPVWERMSGSFGDPAQIGNATETYVGRLTPLTRLMFLRRDGRGMLLGDGFPYPSFPAFPAEPTASVVIKEKDKKPERALLSFHPSRAVWRELGGIVVKRDAANGTGGPISLNALQDDERCDIVVSALARDQASIVDTSESVYGVVPQLRTEAGTKTYEDGVKMAEDVASKLGWAVETYRLAIDGAWDGRLKGAGPSKGELKAKLHSGAALLYWTDVERRLCLLFDCVEAIGSELHPARRKEWEGMLWDSARSAYRAVCGQRTPRQMEAFAKGLQKLQDTPQAKHNKEERRRKKQ